MPPSHLAAMQAIEQGRTEALGGHLYECPACHEQVYSYHSCKNRSCPKCGHETALKYLAPYIFRIALSNHRILKLEHEQVTFRYQEGESKRWRTATLAVFEFIRRFLQHVLPKGFVKVRSYGLLAAGNRRRLRLAQALLGSATPPSAATVTSCELALPALQTLPCPRCGQPMLPIRRLPRQHRGWPRAPPSLAPLMPG